MRLLLTLSAVAALAVVTPHAHAGGKNLPVLKEWRGSVEDLNAKAVAPGDGYVAGQKALTNLWKAWNVGAKAPKIDLDKQLILVATTRGSRLNLTPRLDEAGNLQVLAVATRDLRPGFRYVIIAVPREGVRSVNGKKLQGAE